jgi:hypothetical protein
VRDAVEKKKGEIPPGPPFVKGGKREPPLRKRGERSPPLKKGDLGGFQSFLTKWEMKFSLVLW